MTKFSNPQREADLELMEDLCELDAGLNSWEIDFINDVSLWLETHADRELSETQREKAQEILERIESEAF